MQKGKATVIGSSTRLIVREFAQRCGEDYDQTYAPVVKDETIQIIFTALRCEGCIPERRIGWRGLHGVVWRIRPIKAKRSGSEITHELKQAVNKGLELEQCTSVVEAQTSVCIQRQKRMEENPTLYSTMIFCWQLEQCLRLPEQWAKNWEDTSK